jgi:hypothetical protein
MQFVKDGFITMPLDCHNAEACVMWRKAMWKSFAMLLVNTPRFNELVRGQSRKMEGIEVGLLSTGIHTWEGLLYGKIGLLCTGMPAWEGLLYGKIGEDWGFACDTVLHMADTTAAARGAVYFAFGSLVQGAEEERDRS